MIILVVALLAMCLLLVEVCWFLCFLSHWLVRFVTGGVVSKAYYQELGNFRMISYPVALV